MNNKEIEKYIELIAPMELDAYVTDEKKFKLFSYKRVMIGHLIGYLEVGYFRRHHYFNIPMNLTKPENKEKLQKLLYDKVVELCYFGNPQYIGHGFSME